MSRLCEQTREMLSLYIDDMLSETEKEIRLSVVLGK